MFLVCLLSTALANSWSSAGAIYYKFDGSELANTSKSGWPNAFKKYELMVVNPGLHKDTLAQLRQQLPNTKLVVYTCMAWAYVSQPCTNCTSGNRCRGCPNSRCVDIVDAQGNPYWNETWNVRNLHDGRPICPFGGINKPVVPGMIG
jgi:hypothetical protein